MKLDNDVLLLLKSIVFPLFKYSSSGIKFTKQLYLLSCLNGIPLTYLNIVRHEGISKNLLYKHLNHFERLVNHIIKISELLADFNYGLIKTLRPYPEDTADIDILNLGSNEDYGRIVNVFRKMGFKIEGQGPYSTGIKLSDGIIVDIYNEVSANRVIYLDKRKLLNHTKWTKLRGTYVKTLTPEADLLLLIAHSAIKENYTLANFLTALHYFHNGGKKFINDFVSLVKENNLSTAARWFLSISLLLYAEVCKVNERNISDALFLLGPFHSGAHRSIKNRSFPPFTCDFITLCEIFREKVSEPIFIRSICDQLFHSIKPNRFLVRMIMYKLLKV